MSPEEQEIWNSSSALSKRQLEILAAMDEGTELLYSNPGGWWLENDKVSSKLCWNLLRMVLISVELEISENYICYKINEWGRNRLEESRTRKPYKPKILNPSVINLNVK